MSKYLILGGAGFVGSHLAESLLQHGHDVVVVDDLSRGRYAHIAPLTDESRFEFVNGEIPHLPDLTARIAQVDAVFHLSTIPPRPARLDDARCLYPSYHASRWILETAARYDKRVILASSSEVYRRLQPPTARQQRDSDPLRDMMSVQALTIECLAREFPARTTIVRLFDIVGPRQNKLHGAVMLKMIEQAAHNKVIEFLPGLHYLLYVSDLVRWLMLLAKRETADGETMDIGNPTAISSEELAQAVRQITDAPAKVRPVDSSGVPSMRPPNVSRLIELTGYAPRVTIESAIRSTFRWWVNEFVYSRSRHPGNIQRP